MSAITLNKINIPSSHFVKQDENKISKTALENIPISQQPYKQGKKYFYNAIDAKINHMAEALRIFWSTQKERLLSLIGKIIQVVAKWFNYSIEPFKNCHYFLNQENKKEEIYANDEPVGNTNKATSYWLGHASCFLHIPLNDQVKVNIITDPVEGDLNALFYPRMTESPRKIEECPAPNIYFLSHNHLDHFDKTVVKKLRKHQPIMMVPEGDGHTFKKLGFQHVYEMNWWQKLTIPFNSENLEITTVPAHHWSGGHKSAFIGFVIHRPKGDIYYAGDTARLSDEHIATLRQRFNIKAMFQPGGPDEVRKDMESTHQSSADGLWMHFKLMVTKLYESKTFASKQEFIEEAKKLRTVYMHMKTYKLGNLHFDDTDKSVARIKEALVTHSSQFLKSYEKQVYEELLEMGITMNLSNEDMVEILSAGVIIPKIGSRTDLT